ncbi:hypothetical protein WSM22_47540 [Cytophagales bacterium WSM2-2]|nr:hypothetical protein WSM22_47540 [Cytophagales bacterium WSM2-2]
MKRKLAASKKTKAIDPVGVYAIMRDVLLSERRADRVQEHFWILSLDENNKLLLLELVSFGPAAKPVEPSDVFSFALQKKAAKIIMVLTHPGGNVTPTFPDKEFTERIVAIGEFVRMPVADHLIISENSYYSFADSGVLQQIKDEKRYDLTFSKYDKPKPEIEKGKGKK